MNKDIRAQWELLATEMGPWRCLRKILPDKIQNEITGGRD
jgi:hypothetical protein